MSTSIGLISDVHAAPTPLREALAIFRDKKVKTIICPGDIAGYDVNVEETIDLLVENDCQVMSGNHDVWKVSSPETKQDTKIKNYFDHLPLNLELTIENKKVFVVHANPPDSQHGGIKILDENGNIIPEQFTYWTNELKNFDHDVLIVGHTHQVFSEYLGKVFVVNPGSTKFNHTCMILSLPEMTIEIFSLENREPRKVWNWGMDMRK